MDMKIVYMCKKDSHIYFCLTTAASVCPRDNQGREYLLMFLEHGDNSGDVSIYAISATGSDVAVTVHGPALPSASSFSVGSSGSDHTINSGVLMSGSGQAFKGLMVTAPNDIVVFGQSRASSTCGAFIAYPTDALGRLYYAMSWYPFTYADQRKSQIGVVAKHPNTVVNLRLLEGSAVRVIFNGNSYTGGQVLTATLNELEAMQIQTDNYADLTGTRIEANQDIAVFSGSSITNIESTFGDDDDHIVEQLPPANSFGKTFYVHAIPDSQRTSQVKIVASYPNTRVFISGQNELLLANEGDFGSRTISPNAHTYITADKPVLVASFDESPSEANYGAPTMSIIPPQEQFRNVYQFITPRDAGYTTYLMLVVEYNYRTGIIVDGNPVPDNLLTRFGTTNYYGTVLPLNSAVAHTAYHQMNSIRFGAYIYSVAPNDCAVAYAAGACLNDIVSNLHEHMTHPLPSYLSTVELTLKTGNYFHRNRMKFVSATPLAWSALNH